MLRDRVKIRSIMKVVAFMLVTLYAVQIFNNTFYLHTHVLSNGKVLTHAHPYHKSDDSGSSAMHKHTWEQIVTIENIEVLFPVFFLFLFLINLERNDVFDGSFLHKIRPACVILHKERAPPFS